jgi:hypothetical protein
MWSRLAALFWPIITCPAPASSRRPALDVGGGRHRVDQHRIRILFRNARPAVVSVSTPGTAIGNGSVSPRVIPS